MIALRQQCDGTVRRESLVGDAAMGVVEPDGRDDGHLPVVAALPLDTSYRRRRAVGDDRQPGVQRCFGICADGDRRRQRRAIDCIRRRAETHIDAGSRQRVVEGVLQRAIRDDVTERGHALLGCLEAHRAETARLRDVDREDRRRGAGDGGERRPDAEPLEYQPRTV